MPETLQTLSDSLLSIVDQARVEAAGTNDSAARAAVGDAVRSAEAALTAVRRDRWDSEARNIAAEAQAKAYFDSLDDRRDLYDIHAARLTALKAALATRLGLTDTQIDALVSAVSELDDDLEAEVATARADFDAARLLVYTHAATVAATRVAFEHVESRLLALGVGADAAMSSFATSLDRAAVLEARSDARSHREAVAWLTRAHESAEALRQAFDVDSPSFDVHPGATLSHFTDPLAAAYAPHAAALLELHEASRDLEDARLRLAIAEEKLRTHRSSLADIDDDIAAAIASF